MSDGTYYWTRFEREVISKLNALEKSVIAIVEGQNELATLAETLGQDETTLAEVIPALAKGIEELNASIAKLKEELEHKVANPKTEEELKAAQAELAAVNAVTEKLGPIVTQAKELVPKA